MLLNKNGEKVMLSSTGTGLQNIGTLVITESGDIFTSIISNYSEEDTSVKAFMDQFNREQEEKLSEKISSTNFPLAISENGIRLVRNRETNAGNLVADAFRASAKSDIAIVNGGGIRVDIPAGDITYGNVRNLMPFQNALCCVKATGSEIADALEFAYSKVQNITSNNGSAVGENGGFLQISGLKCVVDTSIESSVNTDDDGMFVSVDGARRVSEIQVLQSDGSYVPLEMDKTYTVASYNYLLMKKGDGYSMFADNEFVISEGIIDYQVLIDYIHSMGNSISEKYNGIEGRIIIN